MLTVDLHPYQAPAVDLLLERESLLIAMEMGLGKTITTLAIAEHLLGEGEVSTVLIVAPSGLLMQWAASIAAHTDVTSMSVVSKGEVFVIPEPHWCEVVSGTPERKRAAMERIAASPPPYVVTSYDTAVANLRTLRKISQMAVIDEVTALKGFRSARARSLRKLRTRFRVGLSGAPVENQRPEEAWAIMRWIDPTIFGPYEEFEKAYIRRSRSGRPTHFVNLDVLHRKLSAAMYRKRTTDPDVAPFLPAVDRQRWPVNLPSATRVVYEQIMRDLDAELRMSGSSSGGWDVDSYYGGTDESSGAGRVMAIHQVAQMLLCHPNLVRVSARTFIRGEKSSQKSGSAYAASLVATGCLDGLNEAPKLDVLYAKVTEILQAATTNKIIIVSKYREMQPIFEQIFERYNTVCYHGQLNHGAKSAAVSRFETDPDVRIMIMSHAGAYGVDIPAGSDLIKYDPPRSSGQGKQLDARHVRAGSSHRRVRVADIYTVGTIEERLYDALDFKARVSSAVTDGDELGVTGSMANDVPSLTRHVAEALALAS
ncbi:DEAD/DEAH box helicase [Streptosporangium sp. NPDC023825]|uniref:DEAD/DEAH box helicase n=1 Tax=Streptosporangium sp. NPDC023825 TaxID=3154909 RepID=UPI0034389009